MLSDGLDQAILRLVAAGETRSESIATALGRPARTVKYRLARLRDAGLVESPSRGNWRPTGAGNRAALAATVPEPAGWLDALEALPAEHQAALRLIEGTVIARRALGTVHTTNWPGFLLLGPTKTGKTLIGQLAARRFGLQPDDVIRRLGRMTTGRLLGRGVQESAEAWRIVSSPLLGLPLVMLDEFDKAGRALQQASFDYLAGESSYGVECKNQTVRATTVVALNKDPSTLLPDEVLRRCVVLDMSGLVAATADLDRTARRLTRAAVPVLDPALAPPAAELPEEGWDDLRRILRTCLTDRGWGLVDVEAISRIVLGYWAQEPDLMKAVASVAIDYLVVADTRPDLLEADWAIRFEAAAGPSDGPIAATLAAARARRVAGQDRQATAESATRDASLELAGNRARLLDALDHAVRSAPRGRDLMEGARATIATARGKAHRLHEAIAGARSPDALAVLEPILEPDVLAPLRTVTAALEGRRQAAVQSRQRDADARNREVVRKQAERGATQADQRAAKSRHAELQRLYRRVRTSPGEDVLAGLLAARCLMRRSEQYEEETLVSIITGSIIGRGIRSLLGSPSPPPEPEPPPNRWGIGPPLRQPSPPVPSGPQPRYVTGTRTWFEDRAGRRYQSGELVAWGSAPVLAVIEAAAAAEDLPRLTRPRSRRRQPARRVSPSSSRRRR